MDINKDNLFLHVCCAPCSSEVLNELYSIYNVFIIYSNDNLDTFLEYNLRLYELKSMINKYFITCSIINASYCHDDYLKMIKGYEKEPEGGKRCEKCFIERFTKTFEIAKEYIIKNNLSNMKNYLCSTLSISPHKNAKLLNKIGENLSKKYCDYIIYMNSDFKKNDGYLKSIKYSKLYGLYRQKYCGCEFAKNDII